MWAENVAAAPAPDFKPKKKEKKSKKDDELFECLECQKTVVGRSNLVFWPGMRGDFWCSNACRDAWLEKKQEKEDDKLLETRARFQCLVCETDIPASCIWTSQKLEGIWCSKAHLNESLKNHAEIEKREKVKRNLKGSFANSNGSTFKRIDGAWYKMITIKPRGQDERVVYIGYNRLPDIN